MKNLRKKLKKTNKIFRYLFYIIILFYAISIGFMTQGLLLLSGIETFIRYAVIITLIILLIIYLISSLVFLILKRHVLLISISVLILFFGAINVFGYYYINKTYNYLDKLSQTTILYTTNLVALKDNTNIKKVGMINEKEDIEGYILPKEYLSKNNLGYETEEYDDYFKLLEDLYNKTIDAIFITSNYTIVYSSDERYENIASETYVVAEYSKEMENQDLKESTNKAVTEPFSILVIGVDSQYEGLNKNSAFNGDALMLITFNPKTLSATVFGIPRDTYVPIACNNGRSNKINAAAAYGSKCMINTIENLIGFEIDYYAKMNFKGVVALVDALGGIEAEVPEPNYPSEYCLEDSNRISKNICLTAGYQTLDGEHALALARVRKAFTTGDFKRVQNQQIVIEAIAKKAKGIRNISDMYNVLNAISNNLDTNMATKEILNFYNVGKSILLKSNFGKDEFINIQRTYLSGYDLTLYLNGINTYTFQYYEESLNEIVNAMKVNLEITKPELIKTFNFSVEDEYIVEVIGKKFSSTKRNETLPSFLNQNISYLDNWNSTRGLTIYKNYRDSNLCIEGEILEQSVHSGTLVSSISSLTVTVCKNIIEYNEPDPTPENQSILDPAIEDLIH